MGNSTTGSRQKSSDPLPRIAEHAHPGAVFAPAFRVPRLLHRAEDPFRMGHQYREASVMGGESSDACGRSVRIQRIDLGRRAAIVDEAQRVNRLRSCLGRIEGRGAFDSTEARSKAI